MLKYGLRLEAAFCRPGGDALRQWIDDCPNSRYSALTFKGGAAWRRELERDLGAVDGIRALLDGLDDDALHALMTNLAGHDMAAVLDAFHQIDDDLPTCFIAYTIKGHGLPLAGHKDNHAGLMSREQMAGFQATMKVPAGREWDPFAGLDLPAEELDAFLRAVPFAQAAIRVHDSAPVAVPARLEVSIAPHHVDAGGLRTHPERSRANGLSARPAIGDDLARRDRVHQPRRLGQSPRHLRPPRAARRRSATSTCSRPSAGRCRPRASTSSWASPRTTSS